jgi:tRNA-Thr(GGU) m(6)t(6)A37 methyltransferase TsaA
MEPGGLPHQIPKLETKQLILRPFVPADAARVQLLAGDRELASPTLHIPHPYPDGAAEAWIASHGAAAAEGKGYTFALVQKEDGLLVGCLGIGVHQPSRSAELAYWVGRPYWGKGYATEAAREVMRFGFEILGLNKIWAAFMTRNPASGRVMQKLGMTFEGIRRQQVIKWGNFEDIGSFSILRSEYEAGGTADRGAAALPVAMTPIGTVQNGQTEAVDEGWGDVTSEIVLRPELKGIFDGLEAFSHALIIYYMHETPAVPDVKRRPRGRADMPEVGLLAQRARHRPNPIGVTAARVVAVAPDRLTVRGLDAIHGTPVLDVKPYFPAFDRRDDATVPEWADRLMQGYFAK